MVKKKVKGRKGKKKDIKKRGSKKEGKAVIFTTGKRKKAVARASIRPGSGKIFMNGESIENFKNEVLKLRLEEPFIFAGEGWKSYDFIVNVKGGGILGQVDAARQSIARGLVEIFGHDLKQKFLEYDRNLLVYDPRRTEPHKPPRSSQGPRRYKQRSKR